MVHRTVKRGVARYTVLVVGLGAAGVAIGWLCHDLPAPVVHRMRIVRPVRVVSFGLRLRRGAQDPCRRPSEPGQRS